MILGGTRSASGSGSPRPAGSPGISHLLDDRLRVYCAEHGLDRTVDTEAHATNLLALHLRKDHPGDPAPGIFHLSDAAAYVAVLADDPLTAGPARDAVLRTWALLVGTTDLDDALTYARRIAPENFTATTLPF